MKWIHRIVAVLALCIVLLLIGGCVRWRWNECRSVGHGVAYCVWTVSQP